MLMEAGRQRWLTDRQVEMESLQGDDGAGDERTNEKMMVMEETKRDERKTERRRRREERGERRYRWMKTCSREKIWRSSTRNLTHWHWKIEG